MNFMIGDFVRLNRVGDSQEGEILKITGFMIGLSCWRFYRNIRTGVEGSVDTGWLTKLNLKEPNQILKEIL